MHAYMGTDHAYAHVAFLDGETLLAGKRILPPRVLNRPVAVPHGNGLLLRDQSAIARK